jgi:hypothetical protein
VGGACGLLFPVVSARSAGEDPWKVSETAAAKAAKSAHFAEAERLLSANLNLAGNLGPKDHDVRERYSI